MYERELRGKLQRLMDSGFTYEQALGLVNYIEQEKAAESEIEQTSAIDKKRFILRILESVIKAAQEIRNSAHQNWEDFVDSLLYQFGWSQPRYEVNSLDDDVNYDYDNDLANYNYRSKDDYSDNNYLSADDSFGNDDDDYIIPNSYG